MKTMKRMMGMILVALLIGGLPIAALCQPPQGSGPAKDTDETRIADLVTACHVLVDQAFLDAFGHVSVRSASNPKVFFMSPAMPPALVTAKDILKYSVETGETVEPTTKRLNSERFMHSETYKVRPDVHSVIHSHSLLVVPFAVAGVPLQAVIPQAGFLPAKTPVFEIRDAWGPDAKERGVLVRNAKHAAYLAKVMGKESAVILRGHGINVVGTSVRQAVVRGIYTNMNARVQLDAMFLNNGRIIPLDEKELAYNPIEQFDIERPWDNFVGMMEKKGNR